jgi:CRP/FNR family cyclic AMP-dependent transcriptional regulator
MESISPLRLTRDCEHCQFRSQRKFCNLNVEELRDFESIGVQLGLSRGATLFQEDEPSQGVFVICTGQVKLSCTSRDGRTLILKIAMAGDVLGLGAVISGTKYEVTAEAIEPTQVKSIRRQEFLDFLEKHGEASLHAAKALAEEYKTGQRRAGWLVCCWIGGARRRLARRRCGSRWR